MQYTLIPILALHLLPLLSVLLTWKQPWAMALERIVRVQIIGSVLYVPLCSLFLYLGSGWFPASFSIADLFTAFDGMGALLYGTAMVTAAAVTALAAWLRRRAAPQ